MPSAPVLLLAPSDSHLAQLWSLRPWWKRRPRTWISPATPEAVALLHGEDVRWAPPVGRCPGSPLRTAALAVRTFARQRPAVVVSTGAALPFFVAARLVRVPTVYIDAYQRIDTPTLTARLCRPFIRLSLAQWEEQRDFMPTAITVGPLL